MRRADFYDLLLLLLAVLVAAVVAYGCHSRKVRDVQVQAEEQDKSAKTTEEKGTKTTHQDPIELDVNTTQDDNAVIVLDADGSVQVEPVGKHLTLPKGSKVIGTVPIRQTVKNEAKHIGARVDQKDNEKKSTEDKEMDKKEEVKYHGEDISDVGPGWKFYLWLSLGICAAMLAAVWGYLKFIKKAVWL
jgi:PBP1b-binding outer membrane lipoprotein LpoB